MVPRAIVLAACHCLTAASRRYGWACGAAAVKQCFAVRSRVTRPALRNLPRLHRVSPELCLPARTTLTGNSMPAPEPIPQNATDRRRYQRHLGHAAAIVIRESDAMRKGIAVNVDTICAEGLGITSAVPLTLGERVKITLRNDIQRFKKEFRAQVCWIEPSGDKFRIGMSLSTRMLPLDLMQLRRAGATEQGINGRVWV